MKSKPTIAMLNARARMLGINGDPEMGPLLLYRLACLSNKALSVWRSFNLSAPPASSRKQSTRRG